MSPPPSRRTRLKLGGVAIGLGMFLVGAASMAGVIFTLYDTSPMSWEIGYHMGLPGTLLASAVAQLLILIGGWMIWRSIPD